MSASWRMVLAFLGSGALALAVLALVLGRDDVPTATYLVYTSEVQPLPRDGLAETRTGEWVRLRFEPVSADFEIETTRDDVVGIVFDDVTFGEVSESQLFQWRAASLVLAAFDLSASQFTLLADPEELPDSSGDPRNVPREGPDFAIVLRVPQTDGLHEGILDAGDPVTLRSWLASWGGLAIEAKDSSSRPSP